MRIPRFIVYPPTSIDSEYVYLRGEELHHLRLVLRLSTGDAVEIVDPHTQSVLSGTIVSVEKPQASIRIEKSTRYPRPSRLDAFIGLGKPSTADFIVEKLTELGATSIGFFLAERTQGGEERIQEKAVLRWNRIAENTLKQCRLVYAPKIFIARSIDSIMELNNPPVGALRIIPVTGNESDASHPQTRGILELLTPQATDIAQQSHMPTPGTTPLQHLTPHADSTFTAGAAFIVGPEGGFSAEEVDRALALGFNPVTLGPSILRMETAAIVVAGILRANTK